MIAALLLGGVFQACNNDKTYAEMKEEERECITRYIEKQDIEVITMEQFFEQDTTTDVSKNQYVLFPDKGVYMQVEERGTGDELEENRRYEILVRYSEYRIYSNGTDTIQTSNKTSAYPDEFQVTKSNNSYSASFSKGVMYSFYGPSVPSAWLLPLEYVKVWNVADETRARVKLIVPHSEGQSDASMYVYPCLYEITYQLPR